MMTTAQYIDVINNRYKLGNATEHTFRGELTNLIESLVPDIKATNEPKRQKCGAPDYILSRGEIEVGYIEAKDIGDIDLEGKKKNKEQFDRYKNGLPNIIFTDYVSFYFYREGQLITHISIGNIIDKGILPATENFNQFENLIRDFCIQVTQTIKSSKRLAELMAGKAKLLADVIGKALASDVDSDANSTLRDQMAAFREILIHDITPKGFADVYAQTIAYGMFAARLHDPTIPTFSREEAATLIPRSNPFLRKLFGYIAGPDIDDRIRWIVDGLVDIFLACNVSDLLKDYGKSTKMEDPIIHFYETFLSMYDPALRKARGVWYTPHPVVSFQIRAIDDILKSEFGISQGIADNSKIKIKVNVQGKPTEREVHRVQMLDPATGTGTYLAEVIKHIYKKFEGQEGIWSDYVENDLLPRLIGFELLMASYAMAHLQIDLLLTETGYRPSLTSFGGAGGGRLKVYLTNSLEESHPDTGTLFANWLSTEANEANHIKRDAPVMIVMGNPPYSGESANKGEWIMSLMEDYKKEPGGKEKLKERNPKWINDDYVKFIRYGQHFIEKNGSGILAFINPHGYLDNPTFRGMRWNLLKTYDKIYTIDLHGNSKKKETALDGSPDVNVFDIMQGVSINIFVKTGKKKLDELGKVFHFDLLGKREFKYDFLIDNSINSIAYKELPNIGNNYFFTNKDFNEQNSYDEGFSVIEIFALNNVGIVTARDEFTIHNSKQEVENTIIEFLKLDDEEARKKFNLGKDVRDWQVNFAKKDLQNQFPHKGVFTQICYRPFDSKWTFYTGKSKGFHCYPRAEVMQHFTKGKNVGLIIGRQGQAVGSMTWNLSFITNTMTDFNLYYRGGGTTFPLYLYPETTGQQTIDSATGRTPNLNPEIVQEIAEKLGIPFVAEKSAAHLNLPKGETFGSSIDLNAGETFGSSINLNAGDTLNSLHLDGLGVAPTPGYQTANAKSYRFTKEFKDELKKNPTEAEKIMWEQLRNKKTGHKIRRQHIIDDFITDFVCLRKKLVIEIDGKIHLQQKEYDEYRTQILGEFGYEVIRFTNEEVFENAELVTSRIKEKLDGMIESAAPLNLPKGETLGSSINPDAGETLGSSINLNAGETLGSSINLNAGETLGSTINSDAGETLGASENLNAVETMIGANSSPPLEGLGVAFAPIDILDYIYAVLHSPTYREKYKEFLKIDFPRVPYPKDPATFWKLVSLGGQIRQIHLLESPIVETFITRYPVGGTNIVDKPFYKEGNVYINEAQYFAHVPEVAWNFYIGGYQPAQKWLKDRKGRTLSMDDIFHYQKIIVALTETDRLMKAVDLIAIE